MKRSEPPARMGWKGPLAIVGLTVVGAIALLIGLAIYTCDIDDLHDLKNLSDGLRTLVAKERQERNRPALEDGTHRHIMEVQGVWNGMTMAAIEPPPPIDGTAPPPPAGVRVLAIDPQKGDRAAGAGIRVGDVVVGIDDNPVGGLADLRAVSLTVNAREPLMVQLARGGGIETVVLPPEPPPVQTLPAAMNGPNAYCPRDGILVPANQAGTGVCPVCGGPLRIFNPNSQATQ